MSLGGIRYVTSYGILGLNFMIQVFRGITSLKEDMLSTGQSFGELNMIYEIPSRATIRSVTYVELLMIEQEDFVEILNSSRVHGVELDMLRSDPAKFYVIFQLHNCRMCFFQSIY
jgi:CRP-like cAMP-binding protein